MIKHKNNGRNVIINFFTLSLMNENYRLITSLQLFIDDLFMKTRYSYETSSTYQDPCLLAQITTAVKLDNLDTVAFALVN